MKKLLSVLLIVLLATMAVSCSTDKKQEEEKSEEVVGMPNPIKEYDSLDKINEITGVHIVIPSSIPVTDVKYTTINDEAAQVIFTLDDHKWTLRGSKNVNEDLSGIHDENNVFEPGQDGAVYLNDYLIDRLFVEGIQYSIVVSEAAGYDTMAFSDYTFEMERALEKASDSDGIAGDYQDATSQRATMEITKYEGVYDITVRWPSSATEETQWYMSGKLEKDKITYAGEDISTWVFDENGSEECTSSTASNNLGYFEIKDGKLYWTGAAQDECKACVFEKMPF